MFNSKANAFGSAQWMSWLERRLLFSKNNGGLTVNGKLFLDEMACFDHSILIGPSGSGKTTTMIIPTITNFARYHHSFAITDPSGEILKLTRGMLEREGYNVVVVNPNDPNSHKFNPLQRIKTPQDVAKVAELLMSTGKNQGSDPFWNNSAVNIIKLLIKILLDKGDRFSNLRHLESYTTKMSGTSDDRDFINRQAAKHLNERDFGKYKSAISQPEKTFMSIQSQIQANLSKLHENVLSLTDDDTINIEMFRSSQPMALFVVIPEHEVELYSYVSTMLYSQLFDFLMLTENDIQGDYYPVFILLEEFANMEFSDKQICSILSTIRKRKVSISIIVQSFSQLLAKYGHHSADTLFANCATKMFLSGMADADCAKVSSMLGTSTAQKTKGGVLSGSLFGSSSATAFGRKLITPEELRMLDTREMVVVHKNKQPALLRRHPWFENREMKKVLG